MDGESPQRLRIALLGPVRAWRGTTPVDLGPVRRQAVLAVMALRPGTSVSHEDLLDGVWGAALPGSGRRVLPSYVFALRKALDLEGTGLEHSVIRSSQGRYGIAVDGIRIDVAELAEQVQDAQRAKASGDVVTAMARLTDALALFRGSPWPVFQGRSRRPSGGGWRSSESPSSPSGSNASYCRAGRPRPWTVWPHCRPPPRTTRRSWRCTCVPCTPANARPRR